MGGALVSAVARMLNDEAYLKVASLVAQRPVPFTTGHPVRMALEEIVDDMLAILAEALEKAVDPQHLVMSGLVKGSPRGQALSNLVKSGDMLVMLKGQMVPASVEQGHGESADSAVRYSLARAKLLEQWHASIPEVVKLLLPVRTS